MDIRTKFYIFFNVLLMEIFLAGLQEGPEPTDNSESDAWPGQPGEL